VELDLLALKTNTDLELSFEYLKTLQPIKTHIQRCEEKLYNCDLIRWFIENGLDARYECTL
jgi:hypothetical protein